MIRYRVQHETKYSYASDVSLSHQVLRLVPRATEKQDVLRSLVHVSPEPADVTDGTDSFGNLVRTLVIGNVHNELSIYAESLVEVRPILPIEPDQTPEWQSVANSMRMPHLNQDKLPLRFAYPSFYTPSGVALEAFARESFAPGCPLLRGAINLNQRIFREFKFDPAATTVDTAPLEVLENGRGVCQDFAHLMLAAMRSIRLPVRYVSGYLLTRPPDGHEKLIGADASHAWVSVFVPGSGWVDLDPTNGVLPGQEHITLGWGLDYGDVAPVAGVVFGGGAQKLKVSVDVVST